MKDIEQEEVKNAPEEVFPEKNQDVASIISNILSDIAKNKMVIFQLDKYPLKDVDISKMDKVSKDIAEKLLFYATKNVKVKNFDTESKEGYIVLNKILDYPILNLNRVSFSSKDMPRFFCNKEEAERIAQELNKVSYDLIMALEEECIKGRKFLQSLIRINSKE